MIITRYVRTFDAIAFAVMYEHETGFMYGVQFEYEADLILYMNGGFILSPVPLKAFFEDAIRHRPRIDFLSALNLCRIETAKQFDAAFELAEHVVECIIQGVNHQVKIGDRVLYDNGDEIKPATVTRYEIDGSRVQIVGQNFQTDVLPARLRKLPDHILTC